MALFDFLFGKKEKIKEVPMMTSEQRALLSRLISQGLGTSPLYQKGTSLLEQILGGRDEGEAALERPAMREFREQIIPELSERFAGLGATRSGAFQQALGEAGASLSERLAAMRAQRQTGALSQALSYALTPFQQQAQLLGARAFEPVYQSPTGGLLGGLLGGITGGAGFGLGMMPFTPKAPGEGRSEADTAGTTDSMISTFMKIAPFL